MGYGRKFKTSKEISGFDKDIIYIVKGDSFAVKDSLKDLGARFRRDFGWYFGSFAEKPAELPSGLELVEVKWEEVGEANGEFKNEAVIKKVIDSKIYEPDDSEWQGTVGGRIEEFVLVENKREFESTYGSQICYTFRDERDNCYVWFTSVTSKTSFEQGESYTIRGTVKAHDSFRNIKQTVLSRVSNRG